MSLMRASRTFALALRRPRLGPQTASADAVPKTCLKSRTKRIPKSVGARTQPCSTPLRMSNCLVELPLNCTVPFMFVSKDSIMLYHFGGSRSLEESGRDRLA